MDFFPLLLDRDGTVIVDRHYLSNPANIMLEINAAEGLRMMIALGAIPVIITNQSGVGRGLFTHTEVDMVHLELDRILRAEGINIAGYYSCPHIPEDNCPCRKPEPGLALQAAAELGLTLDDAVVIGDKMSDLGLAKAIGARGILVRTGKGKECDVAATTQRFEVADDLLAASGLLIAEDGQRQNVVTGRFQGAGDQARE
jgi:D-glycero-D-manno-heptose 1,7-bisphosphate phosphatase